MGRGLIILVMVALAGLSAGGASASWLPYAPDSTWTYEWTDSVYSPTPTKEKVTVSESKGRSFVLSWTTRELENPPEAVDSLGMVAFQETQSGLVNTDWSSTLPPQHFPILCARTPCNNSLTGTLYNLIWGLRAPVLPAPLLRGSRWSGTGGAQNDVAGLSDYLGTEQISVPAFQGPVVAAKVRTEVTQAGALGDPYGSGIRTVWWVYGVGPAKIVFEHAGASAPLTTSVLTSTNLEPKAPPSDVRYFPMNTGAKLRYSWTNTKHMRKASVQEFTVDAVVNNSARFSVKHLSGPIRVAGAYGFSLREDGLTNLWATTQSASLVKFPGLGPAGLPVDRRRRFRTPFDLMIFGFNPVIQGYATVGETWAAKQPSRDFSVFGVTGSTRVVGVQSVSVPAGTFRALVVRSTLRQRGFPFGSGTRTSYFAPGKGLVKLVFRHGDGSVSTVQLQK
jgi:hypothetical protein